MRRESGALESSVIDVLSDQEPMTVEQVRAALGEELAYTTVMTALVRLTQKGLVERVRAGRAHRYSLVVTADELPAYQAALRMRRELDSRAVRADVLANFVAGLEPQDEAVLRQLLEDSASDDGRRN